MELSQARKYWKVGASIGCEGCEPFSSLFFKAFEPDETLLQRIDGKSWKRGQSIPAEDLRYLTLPHFPGINGDIVLGEMLCHKDIAPELLDIFQTLFNHHYPIERLRLIDDYEADDNASMAANNSSCFCDRSVAWSSEKKSRHALGMAVDINPLYNPMVRVRDGVLKVYPPQSLPYADRTRNFAYKIERSDLCHKLFIARGFRWGGAWASGPDYQHFEK